MLEKVFLTCVFRSVGKDGIPQNPILMGIRISKPICTPKFFTWPSLESPASCWVSEWVETLFYIYRYHSPYLRQRSLVLTPGRRKVPCSIPNSLVDLSVPSFPCFSSKISQIRYPLESPLLRALLLQAKIPPANK